MQKSEPFLNDILRSSGSNNWLIISLIVLAAFYVGVRLIYGKYWRRYRQALLYNQEGQKLIQEKNALLMQAAVSMNIVGLFNRHVCLPFFS